jgi:ribosomal protein L11 methyltransferase
MKNDTPISKSLSSKEQWVEITVEIHQHIQEALANFFIELGTNGVILDEEISDPLYGKVKIDRKDHKLICAYLKKDNQCQRKIQSVDRYLKSLTQIHSFKDSPRMKLKYISEEDWNKKWKTFFTTTRIGKHIIIKPSWELFLPEKGDIIIEMDPGMAFGTGTHPTTRMCLEAIENLIQSGTKSIHSMLDVGIGSGILSIAAAKLGIKKIVGIDIDPIALRYAKQNIEKNHVVNRVEVREFSLGKMEERFDLVVANILSEVIIKLRKDLYSHLEDNGILILSGILDENKSKVEKKFVSKKSPLVDFYHDTGWICLILQKHL